MKMQDILEMAQHKNINPKGLFRTDLVRAIQREEGNFDCYATAYGGECDQAHCLWREDCFSDAKKMAI